MRRDLFSARLIATFLSDHADMPIREATIRKWVQRGHILRRGTGQDGTALYDPMEVIEHAEQRDACKINDDVSH